jgi:DNA-binding transcriptional LysR family regulator
LQDIEGALTPNTFDPVAAEGAFTIGVETYGTIVVLPQLVEIRKEAPGIEITVRSGSADEILVGIDRGTFDLAIGSFRHLPDRFMTCHLLSDEHVCVMRAGHPEAQVSLSLEKYLAADHLLLSMSSSRSDEVDEALASRDLARRIVMRVPHALAALIALLRSDMLASVTRGAAHIFGETVLKQSAQRRAFASPKFDGPFIVRAVASANGHNSIIKAKLPRSTLRPPSLTPVNRVATERIRGVKPCSYYHINLRRKVSIHGR